MPFKPDNRISGFKPDFPTEEPQQVKQSFLDRVTSAGLFKASRDDSALVGGLKTVGNVLPSAAGFVRGAVSFLNPVNTVKAVGEAGKTAVAAKKEGVTIGQVAKEVPGAIYHTLVPTFFQQLFSGDTIGARETITNDPSGQLLPVILAAKGVAEKAGYGPQFDQAVSKTASVVTKPASAVAKGLGDIGAQTLGMTTGSGASSIKQALNAQSQSAPSAQAFKDAMRGKIAPEEIVKSAENIVNNIKEKRGADYVAQLKKIGEDKTSHDISPVIKQLDTQMGKFNVKVAEDGSLDFSRSSIANNGTARADIQGVYDTVKSWGTQSGDRTGIGLDILKKQLSDFYSPSSQARAFVEGVKRSVIDILNKEVPGYSDMTAGYSKITNFLDDIKSASGVGGRAKADTVFTKLTTAMKGDKEFRLQVMEEMSKTDPTFMSKIAGTNMSSWIPKGLVGKGIDISTVLGSFAKVINPQLIPAILSTSPRVIGEFLNAVGYSKAKVAPILKAINTLDVQALNTQTKDLPIGLSIKSVTKPKVASEITEAGVDTGSAFYNRLNKYETEALKKASSPKVKGAIPNQLLQEAKKYKSAEEFVKAQGKPVYHGTNNDFSTFNMGANGSRRGPMFGEGIYTTPEKGLAEYYGKNVKELYPNLKKPLVLNEYKTTKELASHLGISELLLRARDASGNVLIGPTKEGQKAFTIAVKAKGYDSITAKLGPKTEEHVILNPQQVLTEDQLLDIWKKANKKR